MTHKTLTPQDLLQSNAPNVWVLNTTDQQVINDQRMRRTLLLIVQLAEGQRATINVPDTFLPTNLSDSAPAEKVLNSPQFLRAYTEGLLTIIDDATAATFNNQPGAEEERQRIRQEKDAVREATRRTWKDSVTVTDGTNTATGEQLSGLQVNHRSGAPGRLRTEAFAAHDNSRSVDMSQLSDEPKAASESEVAPAFKAFAQQLTLVDESEAVSRLRRRGNMNTHEAVYLKSILDAKKYPRILDFLVTKFGI